MRNGIFFSLGYRLLMNNKKRNLSSLYDLIHLQMYEVLSYDSTK